MCEIEGATWNLWLEKASLRWWCLNWQFMILIHIPSAIPSHSASNLPIKWLSHYLVKDWMSCKPSGRAKQKQSHFTWPWGFSSLIKSRNGPFSVFSLKPSISWISKLLHDKAALKSTTGTQIPMTYCERDWGLSWWLCAFPNHHPLMMLCLPHF